MVEDFGFLKFKDNFHYENFVHAWYAFMGLLDVDESDGFYCEKCGCNPTVVVCDGHSLGFRRQLLQCLVGSNFPPAQVAIDRYRYYTGPVFFFSVQIIGVKDHN